MKVSECLGILLGYDGVVIDSNTPLADIEISGFENSSGVCSKHNAIMIRGKGDGGYIAGAGLIISENQLSEGNSILVSDARLAFALIAIEMVKAIDNTCVVTIGDDVVIHDTALLGTEGMSVNYYQGRIIQTPHLGGIVIGDGTMIGACAKIMRGVIGDTVIGKHCYIDVGAMIAHGCTIGDYVCVAPESSICGGVSIGDRSWIGVGAMVKEKVKIGKDCIVGIGSVVVKDVPDGYCVAGNPAKTMPYPKKIPGGNRPE